MRRMARGKLLRALKSTLEALESYDEALYSLKE
jgi:hypothetical protein